MRSYLEHLLGEGNPPAPSPALAQASSDSTARDDSRGSSSSIRSGVRDVGPQGSGGAIDNSLLVGGLQLQHAGCVAVSRPA